MSKNKTQYLNADAELEEERTPAGRKKSKKKRLGADTDTPRQSVSKNILLVDNNACCCVFLAVVNGNVNNIPLAFFKHFRIALSDNKRTSQSVTKYRNISCTDYAHTGSDCFRKSYLNTVVFCDKRY